jgi:S1-C subfamily serine protease
LEVNNLLNLTDKSCKASTSLIALLFIIGLLVGGIGTYYINTRAINNINHHITDLQNQISQLANSQLYGNGTQTINITNQTITLYQNASYLPDLYSNVSSSIVLIQGTTNDGTVQGSGFIYNYSGRMVIITNYHVIENITDLSVTFSNGHGYAATILGADPYADLAVISVETSDEQLHPVTIVSSSNLRVGDEVIAIGNPYGLVGSLTTGVVSALGRSEQADFTAKFSIANMIQTSTPINPGNSGGPLLNAAGAVVGITNSIVSDSQGLGFAVPSNTILRELPSLINTGTYNGHSYLGISSAANESDLSYNFAKKLGVNITYGRYIGQITPGGPVEGKLRIGDIIIAINGTTIKNGDDLSSYLVENTLPRDLAIITVFRNNSPTDVNVILGTRPAITK